MSSFFSVFNIVYDNLHLHLCLFFVLSFILLERIVACQSDITATDHDTIKV